MVVDGPEEESLSAVLFVGVGVAELVCPFVAVEDLIAVEVEVAVAVVGKAVAVVVGRVLFGLGKIVTVPHDTGPQLKSKTAVYVPA